MGTNTIINKGTRRLTFILYHNEVCIKGGKCFCVDGKPGNLHIPAGTVAKHIPSQVMLSSDAQKALTRKQITVLPTPPKVEAKPKKGKDKGHRKGKKN